MIPGSFSHKQVFKLALVFFFALAVVGCQGEVEATHPPSTPTHTLVLPTPTLTPTLTPTSLLTPTPTPLVLSGKFVLSVRNPTSEYASLVLYGIQSGSLTHVADEVNLLTFNLAAPPTGRIFTYVKYISGVYEVYLYDVNTGGRAKIADIEGEVLPQVWSPDGRYMAFTSVDDNNQDIYIYDLYTGELQRFTKSPAHDNSPTWSPDSGQVAFISDRKGGVDQLYVMHMAGRALKQITELDNPTTRAPKWSPEGSKIAFLLSSPGFGDDLYLIDIDGSNLENLTGADFLTGDVRENYAWSPDGSKILFTVDNDFYIIDVNLKEVGLVAEDWGMKKDPVWSPDGKMIAFVSNHGLTGRAVFVIDAEGQGVPVQVTPEYRNIFSLLWLQ